MPKYEVTKDSYLDQPDARSDTGVAPKYFKVGAKVNYDGWPGSSLEPIDAEAKRRAAIVTQYHDDGKKLPDTVADHDKAARAAKHTPKAKAPEASPAAA